MRQAIQTAPASAAPPAGRDWRSGQVHRRPACSRPPRAQPSGSGVSPSKAYDAAFNDYTSGQYDLAIQGFEFYIREFPTSPRAADAQLGIGNSYYALGNYKEAVTAYQKVTTDLRADRLRAAGVVQAGTELRRAEAARPGAARLRDGDQESTRVRRTRRWPSSGWIVWAKSNYRLDQPTNSNSNVRSRIGIGSWRLVVGYALERNIVVAQFGDRLPHRIFHVGAAGARHARPGAPPPPPPPPSSTTRSPRISVV